MTTQSVDYAVLAPVLVLALGALAALVADLFGSPGSSRAGWVAGIVFMLERVDSSENPAKTAPSKSPVTPQTIGRCFQCMNIHNPPPRIITIRHAIRPT
jgi:hypothetical protein